MGFNVFQGMQKRKRIWGVIYKNLLQRMYEVFGGALYYFLCIRAGKSAGPQFSSSGKF